MHVVATEQNLLATAVRHPWCRYVGPCALMIVFDSFTLFPSLRLTLTLSPCLQLLAEVPSLRSKEVYSFRGVFFEKNNKLLFERGGASRNFGSS